MQFSEDTVKSQTEMIAASLGAMLMRNNVGAFQDQTGRFVRYGLMNESAKVNKEFKSSDLIGVTPVLIGPQHMGRTMGIFTAIETKKSAWKLTPSDDHAKAQLRFINLIKAHGGFAGFVNDATQILEILRID